MRLESIDVENYKCFWKAQKILVETGFNLFIGANNSGKTTVLEALDPPSGLNAPHRSVGNLTQYGAQPNEASQFSLMIATNIPEMRSLGGNKLYIQLPRDYARQVRAGVDEAQWLTQHFQERPEIKLILKLRQGIEFVGFETFLGPSGMSSRNNPSESISALELSYQDWSSTVPDVRIANFSGVAGAIGAFREQYLRFIYRFSAQRRPAGESGSHGSPILDRDAGNLPYCINHLQSNDAHAHGTLCAWVKRIFPSVSWVQAPPVPQSPTFQIRCLPLSPEKRREDLAVPLSQMGTGIGNVIAMLYVVLTSRAPQVVAIDEPNSFLHPRALRELLQILATEGKQHQYILTAHSADVLTAVTPSLITLFELDGTSTKTTQVNGKDISSLRVGLSELGIRMTDLHGRDRVLWVEGQTEESVIPELLRYFCPEIAAGTAVLRVEHTGTFETKGVDPKEVVKVYKRLTTSSALVPPMFGVLLDSENRSESECAQLSAESQGELKYLNFKMLENYFLIPEAIAAVLNDLGENVTTKQISDLLETEIGNSDISKIDGAKILKSIFSTISESRHEFKKTRDVIQLVSWILPRQPESLRELGNFLRELVGLSDSTIDGAIPRS
ncbi:AAA family ATPase [Collimonas sp. H4R21]|uniref:AAA family ATPase n=1 Tax=Collimonas rhizosphaerae TaxID=3126357 RepID=A0ABU9PRP3_9BURK